jgi:hypothetical protein
MNRRVIVTGTVPSIHTGLHVCHYRIASLIQTHQSGLCISESTETIMIFGITTWSKSPYSEADGSLPLWNPNIHLIVLTATSEYKLI